MSMVGSSAACRNDSLITLFARFRSTARRRRRLPTTMPSRGAFNAFGRAASHNGPLPRRTAGRRNTASNSLLRVNRRWRPKRWGPLLADTRRLPAPGRSDGKPLAALGASRAQHLAPVLGRHPRSETVAALALDHAWLVRPFHWVLSAIRSARPRAPQELRLWRAKGRVSTRAKISCKTYCRCCWADVWLCIRAITYGNYGEFPTCGVVGIPLTSLYESCEFCGDDGPSSRCQQAEIGVSTIYSHGVPCLTLFLDFDYKYLNFLINFRKFHFLYSVLGLRR